MRKIASLLVASLAAFGVIAVPSPTAPPSSPPSGFEVRELAPGVYAEIRREPPGLAVDCNVVFVVNDADVFVVDANDTPGSARESIAALKKITDRPVRYVINTHWHDDHVIGNAAWRDAFPGATFLAHESLAEYLPGKGVAARREMRTQAPKFAELLRQRIAEGKSLGGGALTQEERESYESDLKLVDRYVAENGDVPIVLPTETFTDRVTFQRQFRKTARTIDVRHLGRGHTAADLVVDLPGERITVTGDLVVFPVPLVGSDQSWISDWAATLGRLRALGPRTYVPGHGPVLRDDSHLALMQELFEFVQKQTAAAVSRGETLEQAQKSVDLSDFRRRLAGESGVRKVAFDNYVARPSIAAAFRESSSAAPAR
jgi:glyoxylase-like metal-dependent hydrolase (beta-lactamase superfamily II)